MRHLLTTFAAASTPKKTVFLIMTTLLLMRHGETVDNVNRIMQGQTQGELTDKGRQQAREAAELVAKRRIDAFLTSDLKRAVDTCVIMAEPHHGTPTATPLLRERDWGGFTGRYIPDLKDEPWPDDIETIDALRERARRLISLVLDRHRGQTVLAVGHGIINKAIQAVHYNREMRDVPPMANAEIRELLLDDGQGSA